MLQAIAYLSRIKLTGGCKKLKKQILSTILTLCLCVASISKTYAWQENQDPIQQENFLVEESTDESVLYENTNIPTYQEAYNCMIALQTKYPEGMEWTNYTPYSLNNSYTWKGGKIEGVNSGVGCVAFAFLLSDEAFNNLPGRMLTGVKLSDVKVGDILRVNNYAHTVIVLQVSDTGVIIAEGNYNSSVHWGRSMSKDEVEAANCLITRYPEGYIPPDDPTANDPIEGGEGTLGENLTWKLTKSGTLTISGNGTMPDFSEFTDRPWNNHIDKILKIVIEDGVTNVSNNAFYNSNALNVNIPASVKTIGINAFRKSQIISVTIPNNVKTISDGAFCECPNLSSVTISDSVKTIGERAFRGCRELTSIYLPASIESVGAGAFMGCDNMKSAIFAPGDADKTVILGDNMFTQCYRLVNVTLPKKIDHIGVGMFQICSALSSLNIPQGAESIEEQAFASCYSLTKLNIPDSITRIGTAAFSACNQLKDIYFSGNEEQWNRIGKTADINISLQQVTIHYNNPNTETSTESSTETSTESSTETSTESSTETENTINKPEIKASELEPENSKKVIVSIETNEKNAKIYYTTNGSEPTINSNEYTEPFEISGTDETIIIKAITVVNNKISEVVVKEIKFSNNISDIKFGDVDGKIGITANDASLVLEKVLNDIFKLPIEEKTTNYMKYTDVDGDGKLTATDASIIFQKTLNPEFVMPVESEN